MLDGMVLMKLVVGLGNPGRRYEGTRHNVGYMVLAELARFFGVSSAKSCFHGEAVEAKLAGEKALLLSPTTFMNLSGVSVQEAKAFYKISNEDLLVICDDLSLPLGKLRFRARGSSGGHKGLEDIIQRLGTNDFPRLRVGIDAVPEGWDGADYVLSKFGKGDLPVIEQSVRLAADAMAEWVREGIEFCMNQYN
jgi:peptidyl-tRNA hydrolase, PTH1 family